MAENVRRQKGESGFPNVGYRHVDGQIFPAKVTGSSAVSTPGAPTVTNVGAAGAVTYSCRVAARAGNGRTLASTAGTTATGNATLDGTNFNRIVPATVTGATAYEIYGRTGGSEVLLGVIRADASPFRFDDTGVALGTLTAASLTATAFRYNITVPALPPSVRNKTSVAVAVNHTTTDAVVVGR
jgi:hypothetical protein